jgi:short-subunit dehydrogenase
VADGLQRRHGVTVRVLAYDLAQPAVPAQIAARLQQDDLAIEVLVNNAGFATYGPFIATDLATELEMIQVNVVALTQLTKLLLPGMVQRRSGRILNVASTAAFQPGPLMAVYYATKAYVLSFSEALANEVRGSGVRVTALCPGPTRSGFQSRAQMEGSRLVRGELMDAATAARAGYAGLMQGKTVVIPGLRNRLLVEVVRFTPRALVTQVVRRMQERVS